MEPTRPSMFYVLFQQLYSDIISSRAWDSDLESSLATEMAGEDEERLDESEVANALKKMA